MPLIDANGVRHHVAALGEGPPLVLLHGLLVGSLAQWYFTAAPALARRHRVVMTDLRGHGRSERARTGYDLATLVADLRALVLTLGLDVPALAGHSYGGLVALSYASRYPVRALALVDVPLPGLPRDAALTSPEALVEVLPGPLREVVVGEGRRSRRMIEALRFLAFDSSLLEDIEREPPLAALGPIHAPVLLAYGRESGCRDSLSLLAERLPHARVVDLPGGHFAPVEAPEALTAALVEFFGG